MRPWVPWLGFGAAGAFLVAALMSAALRGPAWSYLLMLSAVSLLGAVLTFLRAGQEMHAQGRRRDEGGGGEGATGQDARP